MYKSENVYSENGRSENARSEKTHGAQKNHTISPKKTVKKTIRPNLPDVFCIAKFTTFLVSLQYISPVPLVFHTIVTRELE